MIASVNLEAHAKDDVLHGSYTYLKSRVKKNNSVTVGIIVGV